MATTLFYTGEIISEDFYVLQPEESKHVIKVLRMNRGDEVTLTDGIGTYYDAEIFDANPKHCNLQITAKRSIKPASFKIHMAVAPTKNINRFEWFLEKATEIGVSEITPLICVNSERTIVKTERLNKVIIAAMKQSKQAWKPILNEPEKLYQFLDQKFSGQRFIPWISDTPPKHLGKVYQKKQDCVILIGPEGDFTLEEIATAGDAGFIPVSLGPNRLRTETAALAACHTINLINQSST